MLEATSYVTPAIEILDTRIHMKDPDTGSTRTIVDTVADNAADAGIIVAHQRFDVHEIDIPWVAAVLRRNGQIEESGVAAAVLDHPGRSIVWLTRRLDGLGGSLQAGELILVRLVHTTVVGASRRRVRCRLRRVGHARIPVRLNSGRRVPFDE